MSTDLIDFIYFEAKERAFETEIEARKEFEARRKALVHDKKLSISAALEIADKNRQIDFR